MKFCHISDTHLGYSSYRKIDSASGLNQREIDIRNAFSSAIDKIIEIKPDFVLHTGDLFDSFRPHNRTVSFAIENLLRLAEHTEVVIISGNHSTPKTANYGSVFSVLEFFDKLKVVYKGSYEAVSIGSVIIHAVPQCIDDSRFHQELKKVKLEKEKHNILAVHCGIAGRKEYSMEDFGETLLPQKYTEMAFDYVALGHYHKMAKVNDRSYYSGSTERLSFNEAREEKGFLVVDLKPKKVTFERLSTRPMTEISVDCTGISAEALNKLILDKLGKEKVNGAIVKLKLINLDKSTYRNLDSSAIKESAKQAVQFSIEPVISNEMDKYSLEQEIGKIDAEFVKFAKNRNMTGLTDAGIAYLNKAMEDETD